MTERTFLKEQFEHFESKETRSHDIIAFNSSILLIYEYNTVTGCYSSPERKPAQGFMVLARVSDMNQTNMK